MQVGDFIRAEAGREPEWRHLRGMKYLVGVRVADACDELLIAQHALYLGPAACQDPGQHIGSEGGIKRLGAERRDARYLLDIGDQVDGQPLPRASLGQVEA